MKAVSVIVPNYNGETLLSKNIPFIFEAMHNGDQLVIADDHSSDDSVSQLIKKFQLKKVDNSSSDYSLYTAKVPFQKKEFDFLVIANNSNLRFAANCNRAVSLASHDLVFLMNSDVQPESTVLDVLIPYFDNESVFAVGCGELEIGDNSKKINSGKNTLRFERGMFIHSKAPDMKSGETAWVSGGSGLFDKKKWVILGGFDIAYSPAYWEDVDLSFRARERGWKVLFESQAVVHHNHETTNSEEFGNTKIQKMSWTNGNYFTLKNSTWLQKFAYLLWRPYWWWKTRN